VNAALQSARLPDNCSDADYGDPVPDGG